MSFEAFISPSKKDKGSTDFLKSPLSEGNDTSAEEVKIDFTDFSNQFDFFSSSMNFSDIITSSTDYNRSISDSNTLLNEITSKLFQSEGNYSTLIIFLQQIRTIIFETNVEIPEDEAISTTCSSIIDKVNKIIDEHLQMKLTLQQFTGMLDKYCKDGNGLDNQQLTTSAMLDEDQISRYTKMIHTAINKFEANDQKAEDQDNPDNLKSSNNIDNANVINRDININKKETNDTNNHNLNQDESQKSIEEQINMLEQKYKQKELSMSKIIQDLKKKLEKLKNQRYVTEAGIKRIERQLSNGKDLAAKQEDNDARYDKVVDQIKELQSKNKKYSKIFSAFKSQLINEEDNQEISIDNPIKIIQAFKNLKQENQKLSKLINEQSISKSPVSEIENSKQMEEMSSKITTLERDLDEYKSALSKIEDIFLIDHSNTQKIPEKLALLTDIIKSNKEKNDEYCNQLNSSKQEIEELKNNLSQIKAVINVQNSEEDVISAVQDLKSKYETLKAKQTKLVAQTKQVINQTKQLKEDLSQSKKKESELAKKHDEQNVTIKTLKELSNKLTEKNQIKKKNLVLLAKKVNFLNATLETIKKEFIKFITNNEDKEAIKQMDSVPKAFLIFLSKYNKQVSSKLHGKFNPIINSFDCQIHNLSSQISTVTSKYQNLISKNSEEKDKLASEIEYLKEVTNGYAKTLRILFPPFLDVHSISKANEIHKHLEKMRTITGSLFLLIPHIKQPNQKESLYCLILALRTVLLSSKLSHDLPVSVSSDISMADIKLNEQQIRKSILYQNESKIKELSQNLYHSIRYSDVVEIVGDIIKSKPKIINERSVIDMFNALRQKLEKAESDKEKLADYKGMVKILLDGLSKKVPSNLKVIVNQLTTFTI